MWYEGDDGAKRRIGYAVSPKGSIADVSPSFGFAKPGKDALRATIVVEDPTGLEFSASIKISQPHYQSPLEVIGINLFSEVAAVDLLDDGAHGDSLARDGIFSNSWIPKDEQVYFVDLKMKAPRDKTREFKLQNTAVFTTIGPIALERVNFLGDSIANPGDTILVKLKLRNHSASAAGPAITASLSTPDASLMTIGEISPDYWDIPAGEHSITHGYYRLVVSPYVSLESEAAINVTISSFGIPLWYDSFFLRVRLPWWRTWWAYSGYVVLIGMSLFALYRYNLHRMEARNELKMKAFGAEKLREVDRMKSRFFANISHEFRTPLTLIEGPARQILTAETSNDAKENAGMIVKHTGRLLTLVNQLLDLSKIESGEMKLRVQETDIAGIVRGVAAAFESSARRKGMECRVECAEEPVVGLFDRDAVEKVFTNLLSNAFKFTTEGGEVSVVVRTSQSPRPGVISDHVEISVSDTGIGIPPDQLDKVFDRFYQVDQSQTREQEGTGIGLSLTKELVELHKGEIRVTSEPGRGTTFTVVLPLGKRDLKTHDIVEEEEAAVRPYKRGMIKEPAITSVRESSSDDMPTLLIVEDNADMRKYMRTYLDSYRIIEAVNGEDGVEKAIEAIPDLIISDVMMPRMDGFELCARLKTDEKTSHIPVILLTAKAGTEHKIEGLETGADDYITKPFDARELLVRVKNLIEQRKRLQERFRGAGGFRVKDVAVTSVDERFLNRAMEVVEVHISDASFSTELFAREMFLSRMQLHRKIKALSGRSPWELVRLVRLDRAAQLLRKQAGSVAEIGFQIGYDEPTHFTEAFRKQFGVSPSEYMRQHSNSIK